MRILVLNDEGEGTASVRERREIFHVAEFRLSYIPVQIAGPNSSSRLRTASRRKGGRSARSAQRNSRGGTGMMTVRGVWRCGGHSPNTGTSTNSP